MHEVHSDLPLFNLLFYNTTVYRLVDTPKYEPSSRYGYFWLLQMAEIKCSCAEMNRPSTSTECCNPFTQSPQVYFISVCWSCLILQHNTLVSERLAGPSCSGCKPWALLFEYEQVMHSEETAQLDCRANPYNHSSMISSDVDLPKPN